MLPVLVFLLGESSGQRGGAVAAVTRAGSLSRPWKTRCAASAASRGEPGRRRRRWPRREPARLRGWLRSLARLAIWGTYGPGAIQAVNGQALNCSIRPCWWLARRFSDD